MRCRLHECWRLRFFFYLKPKHLSISNLSVYQWETLVICYGKPKHRSTSNPNRDTKGYNYIQVVYSFSPELPTILGLGNAIRSFSMVNLSINRSIVDLSAQFYGKPKQLSISNLSIESSVSVKDLPAKYMMSSKIMTSTR